jgi:hypothetical protein
MKVTKNSSGMLTFDYEAGPDMSFKFHLLSEVGEPWQEQAVAVLRANGWWPIVTCEAPPPIHVASFVQSVEEKRTAWKLKVDDTMKAVKHFIRNKFAWPGGYPMYLIMSDGEPMCHSCAKGNFKLIARATRDGSRDGWAAAAVDINWEDPQCICCHCNERIESAYAEDEAEMMTKSDEVLLHEIVDMAAAGNTNAEVLQRRAQEVLEFIAKRRDES